MSSLGRLWGWFARVSVVLRLVGLVLTWAAGELLLSDALLVRAIRNAVFDSYQRTLPRQTDQPFVRIVDIDERSLEQLGQWPWPRDQLARLTSALAEAGAVAIGFDVVFAEEDRLSPRYCAAIANQAAGPELAALFQRPSNEAVFAQAIAAAPVVMGLAPSMEAEQRIDEPDPHTVVVRRPADAAVETWQVLLALPAVIHNLPELEQAADGQGVFQGGGVDDSVTRAVPTFVTVLHDPPGQVPADQLRHTRYPSFALEMLRVALGGRASYLIQLGATRAEGVQSVSLLNAYGPGTPPALWPPAQVQTVYPQAGNGTPLALVVPSDPQAADHLLIHNASGQAMAVAKTGTGQTFEVFAQPPADGGGDPFTLARSAAPEDRHLTLLTDRDSSLWIHFAPYRRAHYLSAVDILTGAFDPAQIRGRLVLIGTSAEGLRDIRRSPLDASLPGVEIHAQAIDSVLSGSLLARTASTRGWELLAVWLFGVLVVVLVPALPPKLNVILVVVLGLGFHQTGWWLFTQQRVLFDYGYPLAFGLVLFLMLLAGNYLREEGQRRYIRSAFSHYLSPELVEILAADPARLRAGGESREISIIFTDIAGFTSFTERTEPELAVRLLQEYLDRMLDIVMEHGGTVDKMIGDAIIAFFNAPLDQPDHRRRALACAVAMDAYGSSFSAEWQARGVPFGITRIGVHCGRAVVGNFGGSKRFNYTAYGDSMNTTARLESVNKQLGTHVCASAEVLAGGAADTAAAPALAGGPAHGSISAAAEIPVRPVGELVLKGKDQGILTYEPMPPGPDTQIFLERWQAVFQAMADGAADAAERLAALAAEYPGDPILALHVERLARGETGVRIVLTEK